MSQFFDKDNLFLEPKVKQYGSHMVMSNVNKPTKTKYVNVDTKFSDEYNNFMVANYNITLPERINDVKSLTVANMELPMSFYNISSALGNNSFQITNLEAVTNAPYLIQLSTGYINSNNQFVDTIVIPDGYYTISELKTTINSQIDKIKRIPTNSNGNIVVDENGSILYESDGVTVLTITSQNTFFNSDGTIAYVKWGDADHTTIPADEVSGNYVLDAYGNFKIKLQSGGYAYVSNNLNNTNDLRFDYYTKGSLGYQGYFY